MSAKEITIPINQKNNKNTTNNYNTFTLDMKPNTKQSKIVKESPVLAIIALLTAGFVFSFMAASIQWLTILNYEVYQIISIRAIIQLIYYFIQHFIELYCNKTEFIFKEYSKLDFQTKIFLFFVAIFAGLYVIIYCFGVMILPLGDAITLASLYPLLTPFVAKCILGEAIKVIHLGSIIIGISGIMFVAQPSFIFGHNESGKIVNNSGYPLYLGYIICLSASLVGSFSCVILRKAKNVPTNILVFFVCLGFVFFGISLGMIYTDNLLDIFNIRLQSEDIIAFVCIGTFGYWGQFLLNYGGRLLPAGMGSLLKTVDIPSGFLFQVFVFDENASLIQIFGVVLVCIGILIVSINKINKHNNEINTIKKILITPSQTPK